ncbi:conserved hypothetical protein [Hahella chejuensis KCTC 2396]|uniref:GH18 domain-containing protein n=1 Tax=Hahella chejuensis (strain KCTC 2396) TaxID=349521 RepID=Q2SGN9_HAHCH|nr:hypothetical protein [Hahella chejuensis]ABC30185.1 conserved hypothetical protein [Hahella chejuensis KCTC 2396]
MSEYIIGGWTQNPADTSPNSFSFTMYGMVTNLSGLTTGTPQSPGWSPDTTAAPGGSGKVLWTYGGGGCTPNNMPQNATEVSAIVNATQTKNWAGVDFDDECYMNVDMLVETMSKLKSLNKECSYTFLAGWDYNNPSASSEGTKINQAVQTIAQSGAVNRFCLMCYAEAMWSMSDIEANVGPAIKRTIANGVPAKQVILALTPAGLNQQNLSYFLNEVTQNGIGGLFIWDYPALPSSYLQQIEQALLGA